MLVASIRVLPIRQRGDCMAWAVSMRHTAGRLVRITHLVELRGWPHRWHIEHYGAQLRSHVDGGCLQTPMTALSVHRLTAALSCEAGDTAARYPGRSSASKGKAPSIMVGLAEDRTAARSGEGCQRSPSMVLLGNSRKLRLLRI